MTFPPSDSPDWTAIPGALRYLGTIDMSGTGAGIAGSLTIVPASYDATIYVIALGDPQSQDGNVFAVIRNTTVGVSTARLNYFRTGVYLAEPLTGFINAAITGAWEVSAFINNAVGSDWKLYVFAAPPPNIVQIGGSLAPVVVQEVAVPPRQVDSALFSAPGAAAQAIVTFAGVASRRWLLSYATWTIRSNAAAATAQTIRVRGSVSGDQYVSQVSIPATANAVDRESIGPGVAIRGNVAEDLIVEFQVAGPANTVERVTAGAWLLPLGT